MAKQQLFLENIIEEWCSVGNSMSTGYKFDGSTLSIGWKKEIKKCPAKIGDAFIINCWGGFPEVTKLLLPKNKTHKLMWLMSFGKSARCNSIEEYNSKIDDAIEKYDFWGFRTRSIEGSKYKITLCNREDCGGVYHILAYVSPDICKSEIIDMLHKYNNFRFFYFPESYMENILKSSFGLSEEEIKFIYSKE